MDLTGFIAENLFSVHAFLASLSGNALFAIEKTEADELGGAIQNVARHYDIPGVNQVAVDWIRLARTLGMVYGTRFFAMRMNTRADAAKPVNPSSAPAPGSNGQSAPVIVPDAPANEPPPAGQNASTGFWASPGPGLPRVWMTRQ